MTLQWQVLAVDRKGRGLEDGVYVCAATQADALRIGKRWRRVLGLKSSKNVVARRYYPERDPYMLGCGHVRPTVDSGAPRP